MAATADRPDRIGYGRALAAGEFRALFVGQSISISGSSVAAVALAILVYRRTGSPFLSALTFALGFLPYVVGAGFLSGLVDRIRPRRLGVACDLISGAIAVGMAWPGMPIAALLGMLAAMGLLGSLSGGARAALVRSTVAPAAFVPARSLLKLASQTAQIGGNAVGGLLVAAIGPSGAILVNAASFAFSAAIVRTFVGDHPNAGARGQGSVVSDSLRGARDILGRARLRRLLVFGWLVPTFTAAPEALAVPYVSARHGSAALVGVWLAAFPIGLIAGDIAGVRWLSPAQQRRFMVPAAVGSFLPLLAFLARPPVAVALVLLLVSGAGGMYTLGLDGRMLETAPASLFPRTMALNSAGLMTLQGLGFALAGAVAQGVGSGTAIAVAGICGLVVAGLLRDVGGTGRRREPAVTEAA